MRSAHLLLAAAAVLAPAAPSVAVRRCAPPICCTAREGTTRTDRFSHQLARRINSAAQDSETVQCLLLDCMVPKQRFDLRLPPEVGAAVKEARKNGKTICTLGMEHSFDEQTGRPQFGAVLQRGVEARIESLLPVPMAHGFYSAHTTPRGVGRGGGASKVMMEYDATVIGGRPFELLDPSAVTPKGPLFRAEVRWLNFDRDKPPPTSAAIARAEALKPLVNTWFRLVLSLGLEKEKGHLDRILADLGPMPDAEDATGRALWVAGLVSPLPGLALPPEVELKLEARPLVLAATSPEQRVEAAYDGIVRAIEGLEAL